jgi:hypothetical protein
VVIVLNSQWNARKRGTFVVIRVRSDMEASEFFGSGTVWRGEATDEPARAEAPPPKMQTVPLPIFPKPRPIATAHIRHRGPYPSKKAIDCRQCNHYRLDSSLERHAMRGMKRGKVPLAIGRGRIGQRVRTLCGCAAVSSDESFKMPLSECRWEGEAGRMTSEPEDLLFHAHQVLRRVTQANCRARTG